MGHFQDQWDYDPWPLSFPIPALNKTMNINILIITYSFLFPMDKIFSKWIDVFNSESEIIYHDSHANNHIFHNVHFILFLASFIGGDLVN